MRNAFERPPSWILRRAGTPGVYWFGRSPKLVVILVLGLGFSVLLLFCRELRLLFLKALCVYDDEKSLWSSSSLELLLFHFLASRKLLSHAETLIKERRRPLSCKAENLDSFRCLHGICQNRMVKKSRNSPNLCTPNQNSPNFQRVLEHVIM